MTTRDDDDLLAALGRAARDGLDVTADPRWDALAAGDLSAEDAAALEAIARSSEEGREAHEAFRPLDDAARARMAEGVLATLRKEGPPAAEAAPVTTAGAAPTTMEATSSTEEQTSPAMVSAPAQAPPAMVAAPAQAPPAVSGPAQPANDAALAPPSRRRRRGVAVLAASLAAAAALALLARTGRPPPLPGYSLTVTGEQDERAAPAPAVGTVRLGPGARLRIVLRPEHRVEGPVAVRGFVRRAEGWAPWDAPAQIAPDGAVLVTGAREDLFPGAAPGAYTIALAVGRREALPADPDAPPAGDAVRVLRVRVDLHDGSGP